MLLLFVGLLSGRSVLSLAADSPHNLKHLPSFQAFQKKRRLVLYNWRAPEPVSNTLTIVVQLCAAVKSFSCNKVVVYIPFQMGKPCWLFVVRKTRAFSFNLKAHPTSCWDDEWRSPAVTCKLLKHSSIDWKKVLANSSQCSQKCADLLRRYSCGASGTGITGWSGVPRSPVFASIDNKPRFLLLSFVQYIVRIGIATIWILLTTLTTFFGGLGLFRRLLFFAVAGGGGGRVGNIDKV